MSKAGNGKGRRRKTGIAGFVCAAVLAAAGTAYFIGTHHIVAGWAVGGLSVVPKANFSMAEVFVDHDSLLQLTPQDARAVSPNYTAHLPRLDSEQIEISRRNAQNAGPSSQVVSGMTGAQVEELMGAPELSHRPTAASEVRHYGSVLVLMENDRVLKVLR